MTANPYPDPTHFWSGLDHGHTRLAMWAVGLAAAVVVVVVAAYAIFAVAWVFGGQDAVSDNWVGLLAAVALVGGLGVSFAAGVLAVVAKFRHEDWALLRLPMWVFPVLLVLVLLAETFLLE